MKILGLLLCCVLACGAQAEWQAVSPGGQTRCAYGSPYQFFVRKANSNRVLVFFQGGGACWSSQNCDLHNRPSFRPFVSKNENPGLHPQGIFDLKDPRNPLRDYTMVFVAYCSGDVHLGDVSRDYAIRDDKDGYDGRLHIEHRGYRNASAAIDWVVQHTQPTRLVVAGASAGSIAAPFYATLLAQKFPRADIAVFSDASAGYHAGAVNDLLKSWGAKKIARTVLGYSAKQVAHLRFEDFAVIAAQRYPRMRFAQYNAEFDESQRYFLSLLGVETPLGDELKINTTYLAAHIAHFASFTDNGERHMVLAFPRFYTHVVGGESVRDFTAALVQGQVPKSVTCSPCKEH